MLDESQSPELPSKGAGRQNDTAAFDVSGVLLRVLADVVTRYEVTPSALFQSGAERLLHADPMCLRMPLSEFRSLIRRAIALTGAPAIGLHCGLHASESSFDMMAPLMGHVATLRHAVREIQRFQGLALAGSYLQLREVQGLVCLRWEFPRAHDATDRFFGEFLTAGLARMLRAFGGPRGVAFAARFDYAQPPYQEAYAEAFGTKVYFAQAFTGLEFAASLLDAPNIHSNPVLQSLIHAQAEQYLLRLARPAGLVDRLRTYLRNQPSARVPDMPQAARDLGVSVRTLRRRLEDETATYRELLQQSLQERACTLLRDPNLTLQVISDALAFADTASFHRAFKRWTGKTPLQYRESR